MKNPAKSLRLYARVAPMTVSAAVPAASGSPQATMLPLVAIIADKKTNVREDTRRMGEGGYGSIDELAADLATQGQLSPIVVRPADEGKFELIFGFRRYTAAKKLGWATIRAEIRSVTDAERDWMQLRENEARHDLSSYEKSAAYARQHSKHKWSLADLAAKSGQDKSTVENHVRIMGKCIQDVLDRYRTGQFSQTAALKFAALPADAQKAICESLGSRSGTAVLEAIEEYGKTGGVSEEVDETDEEGESKPKAKRPGRAALGKAFDWARENKLTEPEKVLGWVLGKKGYGGSKLTVGKLTFDPKAKAAPDEEGSEE